MKPRLIVPLFIGALLLALSTVAGACGGGEKESPSPTSEATPTVSPPSPTPTPMPTPTPTPTVQDVEETSGHYENTELGFAFDYPGHWEQLSLNRSPGGVEPVALIAVGTLVGDLRYFVGMDMTVKRLEGVAALPEDELFEAFFEALDDALVQAADQEDFLLEEMDWTELAGLRARRYVFNATAMGVSVTSEQVNTLRGGLHFNLDCQGERTRFQEVRAGCQVVLDSFEFTSEQ